MQPTTAVTITLIGVRVEQLPRLKTAVKSYIQRFGSDIKVDDGQEKPKRGK